MEGRFAFVQANPSVQALKIPPRKFTSFLKALVIELDRDQSMYSDSNIVEVRCYPPMYAVRGKILTHL